MAYTLKSNPFGAGSTPTFCFAVDSDGTTVKDFASAAVTADMTRDGGTSIGSATYRGKTLYGVATTNTAFVNFGTNKPSWSLATPDIKSIVAIIKCTPFNGFNEPICGVDSSNYIGFSNSTPSRFSYLNNNTICGSGETHNVEVVTTQGIVADWTTNSNCYCYRGTTSVDMTDVTDARTNVADKSFSLSYLGRRNDGATSYLYGTIYLFAFFPVQLSLANFQSIHDDPYATLFDSSAAGITRHASYYEMLRSA